MKNSILIVDDEGINITALTGYLNSDYKIYVEKDGLGCIETAKAMQPDLILLDIVMPAMDGFEVIKALKDDIETRDIPIIFVTGLCSAKDEELGFTLGAADYINKPFTPAVVKLRVRNQIQLVNQMREIRHLSITDPLTDVGNRRHFNDVIQQEWGRAMRHQTSLSFIIMDIDHFKKYNDTYGHLQGDALLKELAQLVKTNLKRPADQLARWGGEEFAIVLPETDKEGALSIAETIRKAIEDAEFVTQTGTVTKVTASLGLHSFVPIRDDEYTLAKFVTDADARLYEAKSRGRNQVFAG